MARGEDCERAHIRSFIAERDEEIKADSHHLL
jgi:hypothetical protein